MPNCFCFFPIVLFSFSLNFKTHIFLTGFPDSDSGRQAWAQTFSFWIFCIVRAKQTQARQCTVCPMWMALLLVHQNVVIARVKIIWGLFGKSKKSKETNNYTVILGVTICLTYCTSPNLNQMLSSAMAGVKVASNLQSL